MQSDEVMKFKLKATVAFMPRGSGLYERVKLLRGEMAEMGKSIANSKRAAC